jgi:alpha-glucosidase
LPYLYTLFEESSRTGLPVNRPTFFADPADPALRAEDASFLVGDDLLVLAYTDERRQRDHALPKGIWHPYEPVEGPIDPNLAELRVRGGAILPLGPVMQHDGERPLDPLTLVVCPDAQGRAWGTLYEDDGDGHAHLQGGFCRLALEAITVDGCVEVTTRHVAGDRAPADRAVHVEVLTDSGIRRASGRSGQTIVVPA